MLTHSLTRLGALSNALLASFMYLRKVLIFNTVLGLTLPKELTNALGLIRGSYVEVYLRDSKTVVVKRHGTEPKQITVAD